MMMLFLLLLSLLLLFASGSPLASLRASVHAYTYICVIGLVGGARVCGCVCVCVCVCMCACVFVVLCVCGVAFPWFDLSAHLRSLCLRCFRDLV